MSNNKALVGSGWVGKCGNMEFCKITNIDLTNKSSVKSPYGCFDLLVLTYPGNIVGGTVPLLFFALFMML